MGFDRGNLSAMFETATGPSVLDAAITTPRTPMQKISNQNFMAALPSVNPALDAGTAHAVPDHTELGRTAQTTHAQATMAGANFHAEVHKVQTVLSAAIIQAAPKAGVDPVAAQNSFTPHITTEADVMLAAVPDALLPGLSTALKITDAIHQIKSDRGKLTPVQEARLADEMRSLLVPARDVNGAIVSPAVIPSDYDFENVPRGPKFQELIKQLFMQPEMQPEGRKIAATLQYLDEKIMPQYTEAGEARYQKSNGKLEEIKQATELNTEQKEFIRHGMFMSQHTIGDSLSYKGIKIEGAHVKLEADKEYALLSAVANTPAPAPSQTPAFSMSA